MRQPSTAVFLPVVTATLHTVGTLCCKGTKPRLIVGAAQVNVFPSKGSAPDENSESQTSEQQNESDREGGRTIIS